MLILIALAAYARDQDRLRIVHAWFATSSGSVAKFILEVADTPEVRQRGLMYRQRLEPDHGMVFVFPRERVQVFYMKNTFIPLDMVFVDANGRVVGVVENAAPLTEESRYVQEPSMYVIELLAGTAKRHGITKGTVVTFSPALPKAKE